jgi:SAM-dependent methyltransferase
MSVFGLPPSDEPFDFRHQARLYGRFRRDYSPALYDAIDACAGPAAGRIAVDLGCGTGLVAASLARRGWRPVGVDFSAPMLAEARAAVAPMVELVRARCEAVALRPAIAALLTCGTAFHWLAPRPTLAEIERMLLPGGRVALFWRYAAPEEPFMRLVAEVLGRFGPTLPDETRLVVHPPDPFAGSGLVAEPERVIESVLDFTVETFHGWVATVEVLRRLAGPHHAAFLAALRDELERRYPAGFSERTQEYLFLARKPG